jgi:6-pyruvoyltetrahydropterin/6-carboxytetrahydropterin synthase
MPYRICKTVTIDSAHLLSKHLGECRFVHGHTRTIEVVLESGTLNASDMVCDFAVVKALLEKQVAAWDHALCINDADPGYGALRERFGEHVVGFAGRDPTTEVLAEVLFQALSVSLPARVGGRVRLCRVRIWETPSAWAEYGE